MMIADSVRIQSKQIFENIEYIFGDLDESLFQQQMGGFLIWKQMYHLLHSIDKNFIDPSNFNEPLIHKKNLDIIYLDEPAGLEKEQCYSYYLTVKSKIKKYLGELTDDVLQERVFFKGMDLTRIELILAQFRHIFYHIGYLHCCLKIEKGRMPEYVGLYTTKPE